jgi:hypothetical protein
MPTIVDVYGDRTRAALTAPDDPGHDFAKYFVVIRCLLDECHEVINNPRGKSKPTRGRYDFSEVARLRDVAMVRATRDGYREIFDAAHREIDAALDAMLHGVAGGTATSHQAAVARAEKRVWNVIDATTGKAPPVTPQRITETPAMKIAEVDKCLRPHANRSWGDGGFKRIKARVEEVGGTIRGKKGKYFVRYDTITVPDVRDRFAEVTNM